MKLKVLFLLTVVSSISVSVNAQRGVRIGYIDTEYILQNVSEYQKANEQLDKKAVEWKSDIEKRLKEIEQKRKAVENERVLLTRELYDERMEDISFEEEEILDYQQKRFGPTGDLRIQKRQLVEPVQDQIFAAVQEIATLKKFDFIFDKSADVVMLYSAERYDISEQVLKIITRASKREQVKNKKERKALEKEEVVPEVDKELDKSREARAKQLEERKAKREKELEERRKKQQELREARKREAAERRQKALDARKKRAKKTTDDGEEKKEEETTEPVTKSSTNEEEASSKADDKKEEVKKDKPKTRAEILKELKAKKAKERAERQKELEERKKKILEQRKKARDERRKRDSIAKAKRAKGSGDDNN